MTAAELIELLKQVPPDTEVLVNGYEGGAHPPRFAGLWKFNRDANRDPYCGEHAPLSKYTDIDDHHAYDYAAFYISRNAKGEA